MSMRLLQKSAVNNAKTIDRQREIDEGAKLAKRVDSLRELSAVEEKNLFIFRDQTMGAIRAEMEALNQEKDALIKGIEGLKVQKKILLEPLDEKWEEVNKAQAICDNWEQELTAREDSVAHKEDKTFVLKASLDKRAKSISEKEELVKEIVEAATKMVADAKELLAQAHAEAQNITYKTSATAASLLERETLVAIRERDVQTVKESNAKVRKDNIALQIRLADERATLDAGFRELKQKQ